MNTAWNYQKKVRFVHSLGRGAQPMVVLLYQIFRCAMTVEEMQDRSNLSGDAIRLAIKRMAVKGLIHKQVGEHGRVTWLPLGDTLYSIIGQPAPQLENQVKALPDSGATTTTTMEERKQDKSKVVVVGGQVKAKPDSGIVYDTPGVTFEANLKTCRDCNIGEPKASKIAAMPWVSPDFVKAHVDSLYADQLIGLAIIRIEGNELPRLWQQDIPSRDDLDDKIAKLRARDDDEEDEDE